MAPDLVIARPILIEALDTYLQCFEVMDKHDGWLPLPKQVTDALKNLGISNWCELYDELKIKTIGLNFYFDNPEEIAALDSKLKNASPEEQQALTNEFFLELQAFRKGFDDVEFPSEEQIPKLQEAFAQLDEAEQTSQIKAAQFFWLSFVLNFYNLLSVAVHGEKLTELVSRAIKGDDEAFAMAVQVDRTLLVNMPYFKEHYFQMTLSGNSQFLDRLAYRMNNPLRRGEIRHPLLWLLFAVLDEMKLLIPSLTANEILELYQEGIGANLNYEISDVITVRRQRKKFRESRGHLK